MEEHHEIIIQINYALQANLKDKLYLAQLRKELAQLFGTWVL